MEQITKKAIEELKAFRKAFESTINYQKYEVNVFDSLNRRYIATGKIIKEFEELESNNKTIND